MAHDSIIHCDRILGYEFDDYQDIEDIKIEEYNITTDSYCVTGYHIIKSITKNLNDEKYIVELSKSGKALYKTHEKLLIPTEVMANPEVGFSITISAVAKNLTTEKHEYLYVNSISFNYEILKNGNINLIDY